MHRHSDKDSYASSYAHHLNAVICSTAFTHLEQNHNRHVPYRLAGRLTINTTERTVMRLWVQHITTLSLAPALEKASPAVSDEQLLQSTASLASEKMCLPLTLLGYNESSIYNYLTGLKSQMYKFHPEQLDTSNLNLWGNGLQQAQPPIIILDLCSHYSQMPMVEL